MRKLFTLLFVFFGSYLFAQQQQTDYKFRVYLKDKGAVNYSVSNPEEFLSSKAIARKLVQKVTIDASDFPISPEYPKQMEELGGKVVAKSKWFKTLVVEFPDSTMIDAVKALSYVDSVKYIWRGKEPRTKQLMRPRIRYYSCDEFGLLPDYLGVAEKEFKIHNADRLVEAGFQGAGITVAVIDAGFTNFDVIPWFDNVKLQGVKNFVPSGDIFAAGSHGTQVLSTMAVNKPYIMMGSAAEADYWLLRSEESRSEFPVEEDYWVQAVEYADSVGVDVINTSLGYNSFDDKSLNYTHSDIDGKTAIMSRAADKAYEKGMLLVGSAGNAGNSKWRKITVPGDSKNMLTIGALATDSVIASFSSVGPSADSRLKPDLVSVGVFKMTLATNGMISGANGTSFSSPFMAGLFASLWSINPSLHRKQLIESVIQSAHQYQHPDTIYGYGIPDFEKAMKTVLRTLDMHTMPYKDKDLHIYRDSVGNFQAELLNPVLNIHKYTIKLLDENGTYFSTNVFDSNPMELPIPKGRFQKFYIVLKSPEKQKTICIKP